MKLAACLLPLFASIQCALANTEKVIFTAPPRDTLSELYDIGEEAFRTLTPSKPTLRASLPVAFPTTDRPNGLDSWYRLEDVEEDRRYEVRVCWAATVGNFSSTGILHAEFDQQPTTFSLDVFASGHGAGTILLIQSAADFFTTNATLMQKPPPVDVDIILDPYIANVFPQSLLPTAAYIVVLAVIAFFVSSRLWKTISPSPPTTVKRHTD